MAVPIRSGRRPDSSNCHGFAEDVPTIMGAPYLALFCARCGNPQILICSPRRLNRARNFLGVPHRAFLPVHIVFKGGQPFPGKCLADDQVETCALAQMTGLSLWRKLNPLCPRFSDLPVFAPAPVRLSRGNKGPQDVLLSATTGHLHIGVRVK